MSEKDLQAENERLRRELAEVKHDRDILHKMACSAFPVDRTELSPEEIESAIRNAKTADEFFRDVLPPDLYEVVRSK